MMWIEEADDSPGHTLIQAVADFARSGAGAEFLAAASLEPLLSMADSALARSANFP
jgi:hypothetical protein